MTDIPHPLSAELLRARDMACDAVLEIGQLALALQGTPYEETGHKIVEAGNKFMEGFDTYVLSAEAAMSNDRILMAQHTMQIAELRHVIDELAKRFPKE